MGNHAHLLIKAEEENLEMIFKRIGARYVYWYNRKHRRGGHLFQELTDVDFILEMTGKEQFIEFNSKPNEDSCLDLKTDDYRPTDEEAKKIVYEVSRCKSATDFQRLDIDSRDRYLKALKDKGLSIRRISSLTGIGKGVVERK